jgi:hypothetical protein
MSIIGQTSVNITQAPAIAGDPASINPRHHLLSDEAGFKAGSGGVVMGRFVWADATSTNTLLLNAGSGAPSGFLSREMIGVISTYLAEYGSTIPYGLPVSGVYTGGDFWVRNAGSGSSAVGQKAYASNLTGEVQFAATGQTISNYTETKWYAATIGATTELVKMTSSQID